MTKSTDRLEEMYTNVTYLRELLSSISSDVRHSYDSLDEHKGDIRYSLSLTYLSMSHQTFLEFKRVAYENGLASLEVTPFFEKYEHYKYQLKEVITDRDANTSWLDSALSSFTETKTSVDEFLGNWLKNVVK
ncbi:hypothetical protein [Priestia megaterium]